MSEYTKKLKRQIEIVGRSLYNDEKFSVMDLAIEFGVEELTIKRDLAELRSRGIDIHSLKKEGIKILSPVKHETLKEFILEFISFSFSEDYPDKPTLLLIKKHGEKALSFIVLLQKAIDQNNFVSINYQSTVSILKKDILIQPLKIYQAQNEWRLLAINNELIKQYFISKITYVRLTDKKFKPIPREKIEQLFNSSLKSWIGNEIFEIKIQFDKEWAEIIKSKTFLLNQRIKENSDGSIFFEGTVNSLDEAATWILSFGKGVKVIEPEHLKNRVIQLAKDVLSNYSKK